jgi:AcrR family transcriptional regulator
MPGRQARPDPHIQQRLPRGPYAALPEVVAADQRRRLIEALPLAVAESGFEATTVDQIVKLAQVRRNSFYEQFEDKEDCFLAAYEIAQERLHGVLTFQCYTRAGLADRVSSAVSAGLSLLGSDPARTRLIFAEAPAAGAKIATRHHEWVERYGRLLRIAAIDSPDVEMPSPAIESAVIGGIASRVKQEVFAGKAKGLSRLAPELVQFALNFYGSLEPSSQSQPPDRRSVLEPA